ncbi:MAG: hypothetical protein ACTHKF_10155 [Candidatus Nitrosocosmicus sp.]
MVKSNSNTSTNDNNVNFGDSNASSNATFSYNTSTNNQDFNESVNRALDQTKDNINRSIEESRNQIPHYNTIVNSYQEQALQTAREISESYIESQKAIINSIQSAWRPFSQNFNTTVNSWISPETATNAYSIFVSTVADNIVTALKTTNNVIFSCLDSHRSTLQHARDTTKQIFHLNSNAAKTYEQNARELTLAAQDAYSRNNASHNSRGGGNNTSTSYTTSTPSGTTSSSSTTTTSSTSAA